MSAIGEVGETTMHLVPGSVLDIFENEQKNSLLACSVHRASLLALALTFARLALVSRDDGHTDGLIRLAFLRRHLSLLQTKQRPSLYLSVLKREFSSNGRS